jgi:voltage-gated potassium channel
MFKKKIVEFSYFLASNEKYKKSKGFFYNLLENHRSPLKRYFDFFMIFLVLTTVFILIYETKNELSPWINIYEDIAIFIFIFEWLVRLWIVSDFHIDIIENYEENELEQKNYTIFELTKPALANKFKFIVSPLSTIDLLAILPSYRPLRVLRFLLIFRLLKVFRYTEEINYLFRVFVEKKYEFFTIFFIFVFLLFFASTTIYVFEGNGENDSIKNFLDAIYWSVITISTVGYGDIAPVTAEGKVVTGFLIVTGIVLISFVTSVITTSMSERLDYIKSSNTLHKISKLKNYVLICGYGRVAKMLALELSISHDNIVIIDTDETRVEQAFSDGYLAFKADAISVDFLKEIGIKKKVSKAVTLVGSDAINVSIILAIKSINPDITIYSRVVEKNAKNKIKIAGADKIIFPYESAALMAYEYLKKPIAIEAVNRVVREYQEPVMDEVEIYDEFKVVGKTLSEIGIVLHNLKLIGVIRGNENDKFYFNPDSKKFIVEAYDTLVLMGKSSDIYRFKLNLQKG